MVSYAVQKYIAGTDVRVNVVAGELFARRIVTDRVDYRYADRDGGRSRLTEWKLLDELAERCLDRGRVVMDGREPRQDAAE